VTLAAICQPHYLPWIGYFEMIDRVDRFVFLDDAWFIKREWKNRNRIRMDPASARTRWLTVPIMRADQRDTPIHLARIDHTRPWTRHHLDCVRQSYRRTPFFDRVYPALRAWLAETPATLGELNVTLNTRLCALLGIETELLRASRLGVGGRKTARLAAICQAIGSPRYLANNGSAAYLDPACFHAVGVAWRYQDYTHPEYPQRVGRRDLPWISHLSVLDLLCNHGPESLAILRRGRHG